ncbi:FHA domain-containing protein [Nocardioides sp.]|uniref:FHA domain-containing protein n=1 Tax=Nocardioides sp. TaxID=35761 RepID=UPI003782DF28
MTWSCRAGAWFAVLGDHAVVLLPPSEKARVAAVWEIVDDGAGFDETLDALISSGLRDLPGFVLVSSEGEETRVVLRGEAHAHFATSDGPVDVDGETATTWVERTLTGVTHIHLRVAQDEAGDELRLDAGLVRIGSARWGDPPAEPPDTEPSADEPVDTEPSVDEPVEEPVDEPVEEPVEEPPATEAMVLPTDHDGQTRTGDPHPPTPPPGIPGQPPAPPVTAHPVARLRFSTGEVVDVDRPVVVGRAPEVRGGGDEHRLVTVPSPQQEISGTHLEIRPGTGADHGSAVVTDLGSTNGTVLVLPGLPPEDLRAGVGVQLLPGSLVDLGDGLTIEVVTP